ncbi:MAG TPA: MerR family transcriptional regulator [Candidatus Polarisedimenticolia bacterium]
MARTALEIPNKLFYKIGEVCELTDTQPYVLRFWESEFPQLAPRKNRSGQRVYQRKDIETVMRIKSLLYQEEYTIAGARRKLDESPHSGGTATVEPRESRASGGASVQPPPPAAPSGEADHPVDAIASRGGGKSARRDAAHTGTDAGKEARLTKALVELKRSLKDTLAILRKEK